TGPDGRGHRADDGADQGRGEHERRDRRGHRAGRRRGPGAAHLPRARLQGHRARGIRPPQAQHGRGFLRPHRPPRRRGGRRGKPPPRTGRAPPMTAMSAMIPAPARRIGPLGGMRNTFTLTWRSVLKIRTNMEDVIGLSLQPIMFLVLFTYVFGGAIGHGSTHDYLQYELPGLLVMTVVFATLGTGLMLNQDISSGVFDRFRSLPIARSAPLAGAVLGDMVRYLISVAITIGFGLILGFRVTAN